MNRRTTRSALGLTLVELLVVVAVVGLLASIALVNVQRARTRARVAASLAQLRGIGAAIETYRTDYGRYPVPVPSPGDDPFGVVASLAIRGLTTPIAYIGPDGFRDPFGDVRLQAGAMAGAFTQQGDPFAPPRPGFNTQQSLLYFHYPTFGRRIGEPAMNVEAFAAISVGPDLKDSFIVYYPFPERLPAAAARFGVFSVQDTVYDPTNGAVSAGDLAAFGGAVRARSLVGGGLP